MLTLDAGIASSTCAALGTPANGRAAARAGHHDEMKRIHRTHLATPMAQTHLETLERIVESGRRVPLLCFEADPSHCHRSLIRDAMVDHMQLLVNHLAPVSHGVD